MNSSTVFLREAGTPPASFPAGKTYDTVLSEIEPWLFASMPRADQRRRGAAYMRGLAGVSGRKSIRNIASLSGGPATEQSLHHFINNSTWDWVPVRQALARHLCARVPGSAWVVRPMVIPKAGRHSVGVHRRFCPAAGQVLNAQHALGVWAASERVSGPVDWRLQLSPAWLDDGERRQQASIPDELAPETPDEAVVRACREPVTEWGLPIRPVVIDVGELDAVPTVRRLTAAGIPFLLRIDAELPLAVADPALTGHRDGPLPARVVMGAARRLRREVVPSLFGEGAPRVAATVGVVLPGVRGGPGLRLLGEDGDGLWPGRLWLTDLTGVRLPGLLRLAGLTHRVEHDFTTIADRLGIRDFSGRSFGGWHRHVTLASAAAAAGALAGQVPAAVAAGERTA